MNVNSKIRYDCTQDNHKNLRFVNIIYPITTKALFYYNENISGVYNESVLFTRAFHFRQLKSSQSAKNPYLILPATLFKHKIQAKLKLTISNRNEGYNIARYAMVY